MRAATIDMAFVPMLCGSAFKNKGVQTMLDYVMELLPSPLDKDEIVGINPDTEEETKRLPTIEDSIYSFGFQDRN